MTLRHRLRHAADVWVARRTRRGVQFDIARFRARLAQGHVQRAPAHPLLHLGCGYRRVEGFLNVDVVGSDQDVDFASGRLPWPDASFDAVVSQQVIEHLELRSQLLPLLGELRRVMRPGAEAWLACPDMEAIARSYLADGGVALLLDRQKRYPGFSLEGLPPQQMLNELFHQGGEHVNLFDFPLLSHVLTAEAGFRAVERVREVDLLARFPAFPLRDDEDFNLYVRATR